MNLEQWQKDHTIPQSVMNCVQATCGIVSFDELRMLDVAEVTTMSKGLKKAERRRLQVALKKAGQQKF